MARYLAACVVLLLGACQEHPDESLEKAPAPTLVQPAHVAVPLARPACPADMLLVDGRYCPRAVHRCLEREPGSGSLAFARCNVYEKPAECRGNRVALRFCIDRTEYTEPGERRPANHQSLRDAEMACSKAGKRACTTREWTFACEGETLRPFPYGWRRDHGICNTDRTDLKSDTGDLIDHRESAGAHPDCRSPFGVLDMSGNVEEVTRRSSGAMVLKGGYWQPGHHECRAGQTSHDRYYHGVETGFRCCKDAG